MGKEAVAFLLDTSPSMNTPLYSSLSVNSNGSGSGTIKQEDINEAKTNANDNILSTRLSCAKQAIEDMLCDLMLRSKLNEAMVLLLNTRETRHHLCCDEQLEAGTAAYPHITELSPTDIDGFDNSAIAVKMVKPSVEFLRALRTVKPVKKRIGYSPAGGDFLDGLIIAADAIYQRTKGKKFKRRIVILTDATNETQFIDRQQEMDIVINGLRSLDCMIEVIGLDFSESAEFDAPLSIKSEDFDNIKNDGTNHSSNDNRVEVHDNNEYRALVKRENEKLLIGIARLTGGSIIAASTMQQILDSTSGKRIPTSISSKCILKLAPSVEINVRFALFAKLEPIPSLKSEAIKICLGGSIMKDRDGKEVTSALSYTTIYREPGNEDIEVNNNERVKAFRYGSTLVTINQFDIEGLKMRLPVSLTVLGYTPRESIPRSTCIGPTYSINPEQASLRSCTAFSALAQSLRDLNQVALCRFVKRKDTDPILGIMFPSTDLAQITTNPACLFFLKMPFADDVRKVVMPSLPIRDISQNQSDSTDKLIDSLMLSPHKISYHHIPNPCIRGIHKTKMNRAINPTSTEIICARKAGTNEDTLSTPNEVDDAAIEIINEYLRVFQRRKVDHDIDSNGRKLKKRRIFWAE